MPTNVPLRSPVQSCSLRRPFGAFEISCAALGIAGAVLSFFVNHVTYDQTGAVFILMMTATLVTLLLFAAGQRRAN